MSTMRRATGRSAAETDYCPFPVSSDPAHFGLTTSSLELGPGRVIVRHGRRTNGDTATILLHGAAGSWSTWTPLLSAADALSAADERSAADELSASNEPGAADEPAAPLTDLIIPDLPGWGDSPLQCDGKALTIESMAEVVAEIALALGYRRWVVIGHSMGGFIALELACAFVRETAFVGLVSATTFSVAESARHPVTHFAALPGYAALLQVMRVLGLAGAAGTAFVRGLERMSLLGPLVAPLFSRPKLISRSVVAAIATEARPRAFTLASALAADYDAERSWARIRCPVRAQRGDSDVFVADSDAARLGRVIRDFTCRSLDDTGHFGHIERPTETLRLLARRG